MKYAYLHGFASSSKSVKGRDIAEIFERESIELHLPNLNHPSFEELTYSGMLEALGNYVAEHGPDDEWSFIGSSMGGYIAARWAEQYPDRVGRLVLLCPGFNMVERWAELLGESRIDDWREDGSFLFFDPEDNLTAVHWDLYRDAVDNHPDYPEVEVPVRVLHGEKDEIVPVSSSRTFVERTDEAELEVLDDNHRLHDSVETIAERALAFFETDD